MAGFLSRTAGGLLRPRTFQEGTGITITNPTGSGGDPTFSATNTNSGTVTNTTGVLTASQLIVGNGGADVKALGSLGTATTLLHGNAAGLPSFAAVALATEVSGTLADGSLSSNVPLKNGTNAFTGANSFATNPLDLLVGQIKFPATANPSANPNTLDDYEEGTYTPFVAFGGAISGSATYGLQVGFYVRIGTFLAYSGRIDLTNKGAGAGAASIKFLPFSDADGAANGGNFSYYGNMAATVLSPGWNVTGDIMNLTSQGPGGIIGVADTDFTNTTVLIWSGWMRT